MSKYKELFNYMSEKHSLTLLENELHEIVRISESILKNSIEEYIYEKTPLPDLSFNAESDLEQRRFELIKTAFQANLTNPDLMQVITSSQIIGDSAAQRIAKVSIKYADAVIAELKKS